MSVYELDPNVQITITGPAVVVVSPPAPKGAAPSYDPARDPQLEMMRKHMAALGYDLVVSARDETPPTRGRFPEPKPRREGPLEGGPGT